jgi:hypothetical protein
MTKSLKVEGVRRDFYVVNFGYMFKRNLKNLGKNGFSVLFFFTANICHFCKIKNWWEKWCGRIVNWKRKKRNYNIVEHQTIILDFGVERSMMTKKGLFLLKA